MANILSMHGEQMRLIRKLSSFGRAELLIKLSVNHIFHVTLHRNGLQISSFSFIVTLLIITKNCNKSQHF